MKKSLILSRHFFMWSVACLTILAAQNLAQAQFADGNFNTAGWHSVLLSSISASGASFSTVPDPDTTRGVPLPSRLTTHNYPAGGDIFVAHRYQAQSYNPATQGAIVQLTYSYQLVHYTNAAVAYSLLVFQNNTYYQSKPEDYVLGPGTSFTTFTRPHLTASSFTKLEGPSANLHPDFSCNGSIIWFGYVTRNHNPNTFTETTTSAIDNWRVTIDESRRCACGAISEARVTCDRGAFTYTFTVTNNSSQPVQYLLLSPLAGATFTISPNVINLATPLNNGQSTNVTVSITNASAGDHICINIALADRNLVTCCVLQSCVDLPDCPFCLSRSDATIACGANGSYVYTVTLENLTAVPVQQIFVVPTTPANLNVSPQLIALSTPLQPHQKTTVTITITGAAPGTRVCLRFSPLSDNEATCCSTGVCFTLPDCHP
ncbi:MAG: hypothetical protein QOH41_1152 [Blastocatellia bacterium]|jgi:hypothetical protein|nr:hypothetical protein [Blastocatellia bacterium]